MTRTTVLAAAAALLLGTAIPAQSASATIRLVGTLRATAQGFALDEHPQPLVPAGIDLLPFVGHVAELTGAMRTDGSAVDIATAQLATERFQASGNTGIGNDVQFRIDVPGVARWYLYAALGGAMVPLESYMPYGSGTLWLDPSSLVSLLAGDIDRTWQGRLTVPRDPALIGMTVYFQGAVHMPPGPLKFLNSAHLTVMP
jgi:hypothetical protein